MTMTESELLDERTDLLAAALALEEKMDAAAVEARRRDRRTLVASHCADVKRYAAEIEDLCGQVHAINAELLRYYMCEANRSQRTGTPFRPARRPRRFTVTHL